MFVNVIVNKLSDGFYASTGNFLRYLFFLYFNDCFGISASLTFNSSREPCVKTNVKTFYKDFLHNPQQCDIRDRDRHIDKHIWYRNIQIDKPSELGNICVTISLLSILRCRPTFKNTAITLHEMQSLSFLMLRLR